MRYFLGIDLGTSYFKAGVFDEQGRLKGLGRQFVHKVIKNNTICELPVTVFWKVLRDSIGEAIQTADIPSREIRWISYASQANSFLLLDGSDKPLTPLILWPDKRAEGIDIPIRTQYDGSNFLEKTGLGLGLNSQFCIAKMIWFQQMQPEIWRRVKSIMSISDYLTFGLTGQKSGDLSTASMTGLLDISQSLWWSELLESLTIDPSRLSTPVRVGTLAGTLTEQGAKTLGLYPGASWYLGGLDHHIAAIGSGSLVNNNLCESTGTVVAGIGYQESYLPRINCCVAAGLEHNHYFQMAFDENGAYALEWYQKNHASGLSIHELLKLAAKVEIGCQGLTARPCAFKFQGLDGFSNIKSGHQHGHFVRALLESTALSLLKLISRLKESASAGGIVSAGGGAKSSLWAKIKANLLGKVFFVPECNESACLGAAMLGAIGSKEYGNRDEVIENWTRCKRVVKPDPDHTRAYFKWRTKHKNDI
ncbi:MAG: FGGY-family carbohydrate kinase [Cytophagales bacterium]|nr:FGGY-family carbohydrate kinase [Cytophagales bacterium]